MQTIKAGWHNFRSSLPMVGWLYLAKLVLALVFTLPLLATVNTSLDNSIYAGALLKSWSLDVITELSHHHEGVLPAFVAVLIFYSAAVFLFKQFLNGGIYFTYLQASGVSIRTFFSESADLFRGNLKISLFMLFVYSMLAVVSQSIASFFPADLTGHFGEAAFGGAFVHVICLYIFLISGSILSDILRLGLAARPDRKFLEQLRPAINFYLRRFVKLHSIYYLYFVPMVVLWLVIEKLALIVTGGLANIVGVFLELVLFQICSFARTGQSLLFTASAAPLAREVFADQIDAQRFDEARLD